MKKKGEIKEKWGKEVIGLWLGAQYVS